MSDFLSVTASSSNSNSNTRWLTEEVFNLIDMVQRDEAIYNPRHKYYFCRPYVENFWREVDMKLEKNPGASLAKWTNLRISFRREYTNYLEEKVPPCWSYFDRMFFLHPFLRKKHQQPKSLDSQVQDALVQISSLSNRLQMQRERATAAAALNSANSNNHNNSNNNNNNNNNNSNNTHSTDSTPTSQKQQQHLDSYLDYYDDADADVDADPDPDPDAHHSDLDDMIDDEPQARFQNLDTHTHAHTNQNTIKSECDDENIDDYEVTVAHNSSAVVTGIDDIDDDDDDDNDEDADDVDMRSLVLNSLTSNATTSVGSTLEKRQRLQHLNRLQTRSYYGDLRGSAIAKRPRSHENISSTQSTNSGNAQRIVCSSTPTHANVSFVRPTFTKPIVDIVSTTTNSGNNNNTSNGPINDDDDDDDDDVLLPNITTNNLQASLQSLHAQLRNHHHHQHHQPHNQHHNSHHHHHHHHGNSAVNTIATTATTTVTNGTSAGGSGVNNVTVAALQSLPSTTAAAAAAHVELCDCKTDPDAMFLMSLLPDIQKLNGRDRGKIKIAFQNILQDYLYPD